MNVIETVNARIDELVSVRDAETEAIRARLDAEQENLNKARESGAAAILVVDPAAYAESKQAENKALNAIELYTKRLEQLNSENGPRLVTEAENARVIAEIKAQQEDLEGDAVVAVMDLVKEVRKICADYVKNRDTLNAAAARWHRECYRNQKVIGYRGNEPVYKTEPYHHDGFELAGFSARLADDNFVRNQIGEGR